MKAKEAQVTPIADPDTIEALKQWINQMGSRGVIPSSVRNNWISAVESLSTALGEDEPKTVTFLRGQVEEIGRRWINIKKAKPDTGQTYVKRVKTALEEYAAYRQDPLKYKPKVNKTAPSKAPQAGKADEKKSSATPEGRPVPQQIPLAADMRTFPVGPGKTFLYALPPDEVTVKDVLKISCHLLTFASDFDPTNKSQAQVFALARADD